MGTDNIQAISDEVNAAIEALGPDATAEQITAVIEEHARNGVIYGSPSLGDVAAEEAASAYAEQHLPPGAAATLGAAKGRQEADKDKPSISELAADIRNRNASAGVLSADDIAAATGISADSNDGILKDVTSSLADHNVDPATASLVQSAVANAISGGALASAGLDIQGQLKVTVHDFVDLKFDSSHIKTTLGQVVYTHEGTVDIKAQSAYLTAGSIRIEASHSETNIVHAEKKSNVSNYSFSRGPWYSSDFGHSHSVSDWSVSGALLNAHVAPVKVGVAARMVTNFGIRTGIKGVSFDDVGDNVNKTNLALMGVSVILMILG
ncbi:hypothetical protein [Bordetella petrii]|uniref:hypothetical protein n=1 Tax=Bordetella petrii TaxID=94624 RepID=UPI001A97B02E|nr:hypothetical protein [Bordetella petrii]MBO1111809.1 hypothetical protein [Bordetella petrii]